MTHGEIQSLWSATADAGRCGPPPSSSIAWAFAWGGIGVLGSLLLTLGLFTARPIEVTAASSPESNPLNAQQNIQPSIALANQASRRIARPPGPGGTDDISQRGFPEDRPVDSERRLNRPNPGRSNQFCFQQWGFHRRRGGCLASVRDSPSISSASRFQRECVAFNFRPDRRRRGYRANLTPICREIPPAHRGIKLQVTYAAVDREPVVRRFRRRAGRH